MPSLTKIQSGFLDESTSFTIGNNLNIGQNSSALQSAGTGITIYGTSNSEIKFLNSTTGSLSTDGTALVTSGLDFNLNNRENGNIILGTNNTERLRVDSSGNLLAGTTSNLGYPGRVFNLKGGQGYVGLSVSDTEARVFNTWDTAGIPLTFYMGGSERMRIDASTGNVGIGTSNPSVKLHVSGSTPASTTQFTLTQETVAFTAVAWSPTFASTNNADTIQLISSGKFDIRSDGSPAQIRFYLNGRTNTGYQHALIESNTLVVGSYDKSSSATTNSVTGIISGPRGSGTNIGSGGLNIIGGESTGTASGGPIIFSTSTAGSSGSTVNTPTERVRITSTGNIGIGTSNPSYLVHLNQSVNSQSVLFLNNPNTGSNASSEFIASNGGAVSAVFGIGGVNRNTYGPIGANRTFIYTNSSAGIGIGADNASGVITFGTGSGSVERVRITSTGDVGIGVTSPSSKLAVNGSITESTDGTNYWPVVTQQDIGTDENQIPVNSYLGDLAYQNSNNVTINGFSSYDSFTSRKDCDFSNGAFNLGLVGTGDHSYYQSGSPGNAGLSRVLISINDGNNLNPIYYENKEGKFMGQYFSSINDQGYNQGCWLGAVSSSSRSQGFLRTPDFVFGQRVGNSQFESMRIDSNRNVVINSDQGYAKLQVRGDFISFNDSSVGSEKVVNGSFSTNATWTFGTGWEHDATGQKAYHNSANAAFTALPYGGFYSGDLQQNVNVVANKMYIITLTVSGLANQYEGYKSGFVDIYLGGVQVRRVNANGTFYRYVRTSNTGNLIIRPSSTFNGYIDDVSVKEVTGGNIAAYGLFTGGGTNGLKVDVNGNVGIGLTTPNYILDINGATEITRINNETLVFNNGTSTYSAGDYSSIVFKGASVYESASIRGIQEEGAGSSGAGALSFRTMFGGNNTTFERLRINSGGQIAVGSGGSASAPVLTKTDDLNTGIFFPAADTIAFAEGGTEVMRITSDTRVGIGTSSPSAQLHVFSPDSVGTTAYFRITNSSFGSGTYRNIHIDGTHPNGASLWKGIDITPSQATTAPMTGIDMSWNQIYAEARGVNINVIKNTHSGGGNGIGVYSRVSASGVNDRAFTATAGWFITDKETGALDPYTSYPLRVENKSTTGDTNLLGLYTDASTQRLRVYYDRTNEAIRYESFNRGQRFYVPGTTTLNNASYYFESGQELANVGGTQYGLYVNQRGARYTNQTAIYAEPLAVFAGNYRGVHGVTTFPTQAGGTTEAIFGETTIPNWNYQGRHCGVRGIAAGGSTTFSNTYGLGVNNGAFGGHFVAYGKADVVGVYADAYHLASPGAGTQAVPLLVATNGSEIVRVTTDRYIRMQGNSGGIQFNGDTAAANALDDYEQGNWTPVYSGGSGTPNGMCIGGHYVKIGRVVTVSINSTTACGGAGSTFTQITGLPFTANSPNGESKFQMAPFYKRDNDNSILTNPTIIANAGVFQGTTTLQMGTTITLETNKSYQFIMTYLCA